MTWQQHQELLLHQELCAIAYTKLILGDGPQERSPISVKQTRKNRLEFAKEYIKKRQEFWNLVIVRDEIKFNVFESLRVKP